MGIKKATHGLRKQRRKQNGEVNKVLRKKKVKWYKPKVHSGWRKDLTPRGRRIKALKAHKGNALSTARSLQALANVNAGKKGDAGTRRAASADAKYFYKLHEKTGK